MQPVRRFFSFLVCVCLQGLEEQVSVLTQARDNLLAQIRDLKAAATDKTAGSEAVKDEVQQLQAEKTELTDKLKVCYTIMLNVNFAAGIRWLICWNDIYSLPTVFKKNEGAWIFLNLKGFKFKR